MYVCMYICILSQRINTPHYPCRAVPPVPLLPRPLRFLGDSIGRDAESGNDRDSVISFV